MLFDLEDKKNIIFLKNQLINGDKKRLQEIYSDEESYGFFIDTLNIALAAEPAFFLVDDLLLAKAEEILHNKRFDYKNPIYNTIINEIIGVINRIKNTPQNVKFTQKRNYAIWQQKIRETSCSNQEDFLQMLAYDALLINMLKEKNLSNVDSVYFFASTNYLAKCLPEFYQENPQRIDITMQKLDQHASKRWIWNWPERAFAKDTIKNMQKIKTKEE